MTDIRDLKPNSSLLTWLRAGGVLVLGDYKIRAAQANRVIIVFKHDTLKHEFLFNTNGLHLAIMVIQESSPLAGGDS